MSPYRYRFGKTIVQTTAMFAFASGCSHQPSPERRARVLAKSKPGTVSEEVSLKADRAKLDEYRKEEDTETKQSNDELAGILELMSRPDEEPSRIRERFNSLLRKKRDKMDKLLRAKRENFSSAEKKAREAFTKNEEGARASFLKRVHPSDERKEFFDDQEQKRRSFYEASGDKRKEFEEAVTDERRTFEDYVREKTDLFNQEYNNYTARYHERQSGERLRKQARDKAASLDSQSEPREPNKEDDRRGSQGRSNPLPTVTPLGAGGTSGE